jgi:cytochrome P450
MTRPTVDFDHHSEQFRSNELEQWRQAREVCPVAFNERYGGFWAVTGYEEVAEVAKDPETFSSYFSGPASSQADKEIEYLGICGIPRGEIPVAGLGESDVVPHNVIRRALLPYFSRGAIEKFRPLMERLSSWFMDENIEGGEMDLVLDFTNPSPAVLTMIMMGLPRDNWEFHAEINHAMVAYAPDSPEFKAASVNFPAMYQDIDVAITSRLAHPTDEVSGALAALESAGKVDHERAVSVLWNLVSGGIDTSTSLTNWAIVYLAEHVEARELLRKQPELIPQATEEFLRYYSVNKTITRTVTRDATLGGQQLRRGDKLLLSWLAANHDGSRFESPDVLDIGRERNPHLAFGMGIHHCIGADLARMMFQVMLGEILTRIPEYTIDASKLTTYAAPSIAGIVSIPARFPAGKRVGGNRPF